MTKIEWAELKLIDGDDCLIIYANGKKHTHKVTDVFERMSEPTDAARVGELESENRFLSGVIAGMENTDNERIQALERELQGLIKDVTEIAHLCTGANVTLEQVCDDLRAAALAAKGAG